MGRSTMLDWETIRLMDDVEPGWVVEVQYYDGNGRLRMAIGEYERVDKGIDGEWALFIRKRFVGIRMIDVVRIERVVK